MKLFDHISDKEVMTFFGKTYENHPCVFLHQVHGNRIVRITKELAQTHIEPEEADGLITNVPHISLAIRTADCLPIFLYDPQNKAIGLVHAGWQGSHKKIAFKVVEEMEKYFHTDPSDLKIAFGPAIRPCCYEVGKEFKEYFPAETRRDLSGQFFLDLMRVNRHQLKSLGVKEENIFDSEECTCCNKDYFSYRRQGAKAGRMVSVIMLKEKQEVEKQEVEK